jgi:hypothetical protein
MLQTRHWEKLEKFEWEVIPHCPYSPDFAPSDYYLFRQLKITPGTINVKMTRHSSEPCVNGCKILEWTSTAAAYSSSCSAGRNIWIVVDISLNSDQDIYICTSTSSLIKVNVLMIISKWVIMK